MTQKADEPVLISPVTTAVGTMPTHGIGPVSAGCQVPIGSRLQDIRVEDFSDNWMKAVTKVDQDKIRRYRAKKKAEAKSEAGPGIEDLQAEIEDLRTQLKSVNGKIGALIQKIEPDKTKG